MFVVNRKDLAICAIPIVSREVIHTSRATNKIKICRKLLIPVYILWYGTVSEPVRAPICYAVSNTR